MCMCVYIYIYIYVVIVIVIVIYTYIYIYIYDYIYIYISFGETRARISLGGALCRRGSGTPAAHTCIWAYGHMGIWA